MVEYSPDWTTDLQWAAIVGFVLAFLVAFGMGANDCANSYGTVVGSGVLKLWQAYILATIFELLGASMLGYKVTDTMRKSIVDVSIYDVYSAPDENGSYILTNWSICAHTTNCTTYTSAQFIMGEIGALSGTALWLLLATVFQFPVSTTHSAVGATVGFSLVLKWADGINWWTIGNIVVSWVASPVLAGAVAVLIYLIIKFTCLKKADQFESSLKMLPFFYWFTFVVNIFSVLYDGSKYLKFDQLSWWACLLISTAIASAVAVFMQFIGIKLIRQRIESRAQGAKDEDTKGTTMTGDPGTQRQYDATCKGNDGVDCGSETVMSMSQAGDNFHNVESPRVRATPINLLRKASHVISANRLAARLKWLKHPVQEEPVTASVFTYLQILSACFISFSHGSNDTANAVGALVGLWITYKTGNATGDDSTSQYLILFGAASMIVGLWLLGHKVIKLIGTKIVHVTAPSGFAMELGTAFTVLVASKIGIPVSTTHCAVGAIVAVGWLKSHKGGVSWTTFRNIGIAWIVTLPVAGAVSALIAYLLNHFLVDI